MFYCLRVFIYFFFFSCHEFVTFHVEISDSSVLVGFKQRSKERSRVVPLFYAKLPRLLVTCG